MFYVVKTNGQSHRLQARTPDAAVREVQQRFPFLDQTVDLCNSAGDIVARWRWVEVALDG